MVHSFPTRRSSDLLIYKSTGGFGGAGRGGRGGGRGDARGGRGGPRGRGGNRGGKPGVKGGVRVIIVGHYLHISLFYLVFIIMKADTMQLARNLIAILVFSLPEE